MAQTSQIITEPITAYSPLKAMLLGSCQSSGPFLQLCSPDTVSALVTLTCVLQNTLKILWLLSQNVLIRKWRDLLQGMIHYAWTVSASMCWQNACNLTAKRNLNPQYLPTSILEFRKVRSDKNRELSFWGYIIRKSDMSNIAVHFHEDQVIC